MKTTTNIFDPVISVDSNEWYYGRSENRTNPDKRILLTSYVQSNTLVSERYASSINALFEWVNSHEKDTPKRKKRLFYIDKGFFLNQN